MDNIPCLRQIIGLGRNFGMFAQFTVTSAHADAAAFAMRHALAPPGDP
jgi:hypothetical protein